MKKSTIEYSVWEIYSLIDKEVAKRFPICKEGCSYCCNQPIEILDVEASIIKQGIDKLTPEQKERVKQRCIEWWDYYNEHTPEAPLSCEDAYHGFTHSTKKDHVACPLLEDNKCMIYAYRPHPCRLHFQTYNIYKCKRNQLRDGVLNGVHFVREFMRYMLQIVPSVEGIHFHRTIMEILDPSYKIKEMEKMMITREFIDKYDEIKGRDS